MGFAPGYESIWIQWKTGERVCEAKNIRWDELARRDRQTVVFLVSDGRLCQRDGDYCSGNGMAQI